MRTFCEDLEREGSQEWQVRQADQALRLYFVHFLKRTNWNDVRARRGAHLPVVLSLPETAALLDAMRGTARLMATLIYGGGLRLSECCTLRVKDLDFDQGLIFVRDGKGQKDCSTLRAESKCDAVRTHLAACETLHQADRRAGLAGVWLPDALERKYPDAGRSFGWFWVFPSRTLSTDPRSGIVRRHHLHETVVQKAVKEAHRAAITPLTSGPPDQKIARSRAPQVTKSRAH